MDLSTLDSGDLLTVVGWIISFILGLASALIVQRRGRDRRILGWSITGESNLLSQAVLSDVSEGFGVPIEIRIQGQEASAVSTVTLAVANLGNATINDATIHFRFGEGTRVYVGRYLGNIGIYRKKLRLEKHGDNAVLEIKHINPAQAFEVEFLVGGYKSEALEVDMAEPGVSLRQVKSGELTVGARALQSFGFAMLGVRYDPTAVQTSRLVEEVSRLNRILEIVAIQRAGVEPPHNTATPDGPSPPLRGSDAR